MGTPTLVPDPSTVISIDGSAGMNRAVFGNRVGRGDPRHCYDEGLPGRFVDLADGLHIAETQFRQGILQ